MKVFRELTIIGSQDELKEFALAIDGLLDRGWARQSQIEQDWRRNMMAQKETMLCLSCPAKGTRPATMLFLGSDLDELRAFNVVPREIGQISRDEYNDVLMEFYEFFALPAAKKMGLRARLTSDEKPMADWASEGTVKLLRSFSTLANRSSLHPYDEKRWRGFILRAHLEGASLDSHTLGRWLLEEEGWPEDAVSKLTIQYEFARELLADYDSEAETVRVGTRGSGTRSNS